MKNEYIVFYADMVYAECPNGHALANERTRSDGEIYNGAYVYCRKEACHWYRMDGTPVLDSEVPPTLKTLVLLMD